MRITLVNLFHDAPDPASQIAADPLRRELSRALAARGHSVTVVQEHPHPTTLDDGAVRWVFTAPDLLTRAGRHLLRRRDDAMVKAPAPHILAPVAASRPDIIHSFDLCSYPTLLLLGRLARARRVPLVAHFHGGAPATNAILRRIERAAFDRTSALLFTTHERGQQWVDSGALDDASKIFDVFETSSTLTPGPAPRLAGSPALLHVGRLDPVKDPLTILDALPELQRAHPGVRLHMAWTGGPLEALVRARAAELPVTLLGKVPAEQMPGLYRGADALLQASTREVCGRAVLESLATGLPVVLSDIPPFRKLTNNGQIGALFRVGDSADLAAATLKLLAAPPSKPAVRALFDEALCFPVLAARVEAVYKSCLQPTG